MNLFGQGIFPTYQNMLALKAYIGPSGKLLCLWNTKKIETVHEGQ